MGLIDRFEMHYSDKRDNTLLNYRSDIKQFFEFASNYLGIEIDNEIEIVEKTNWELCSLFKSSMVKRKLNPNTINRRIVSLRSFFSVCEKLDDINISSNPFDGVEKVSTKSCKTTRGFLLEDDIEKLLTSIETKRKGDRYFEFTSKRDMLLYSLIITCGLRISEALNLTFSNIDEDNLRVFIEDGKGGKDRTVAIDEYIIELLESYIPEREKIKTEHCNLVFLSRTGKPMTEKASNKNLKKYCEYAEIPVKTNHELRHTFATIGIMRGMDINSVRQTLGHSSLATTSIYTHTTVEHARQFIGIKRK